MKTKPKLICEHLRILNDMAQDESDMLMPPLTDVVKGLFVSVGLWVAYSIAFLTVPFVLTGGIVLVLLACALIGVAAAYYFAYRRVRARQSHK